MNLDILKNKKVLYVEDDKSIMKSFTPILDKFFNTVLTAQNGVEGLELFKQNQDIDFVITDIKMPKMDGLDMSAQIKEISPDTPCILTTAHAEYDYFLKADEIGIYRYITKPLDIKDLINILAEFVEKN